MKLRRLFPEPGEITPAEAVAGLAGRNVLVVNMVASADGRAAQDGRTAPLSDEADRQVFHALRAQADAILVGTGTLREERYGRFTKNDELRAMRAGAGLAPEPVGVIVTRTMDLPYQIPLFQHPEARLAVFTSAPADPQPTPATLDVSRLPDLDLRAIVERLRAEHGVRCILCEGGPTLNAPLFAAGVVDELFLSIAPALVGGRDPLTIIEGELPAPIGLELLQIVEHDSTLLLRYRVGPPG